MSLKICIPAIAAFLLAACGGDGNKAADPDPSAEADFVVESFGDLSVCTDKREGATAYVKDEEKDYICTDGDWAIDTNADTRKKSSSSKDKAKSSSSRCEDCKDGANSNGSSGNQKTAWDYLNPNIDYDEMVDDRDGQVYKTVKIGDQVWMAENLNYKVDSSFCYNDSLEYCEKYGRLYKWAAAVDKSEEECGYGNVCRLSGKVRGVCPEGWHLPDTTEWITLFTGVGGQFVGAGVQWTAGNILKSQTGWNNDGNGTDDDDNMNELMSQMGWNGNGDGSDAYGFSAIPSGYRNSYGFFGNNSSYFWSASENDGDYAYCMSLFYYIENASLSFGEKSEASSVRCIQD